MTIAVTGHIYRDGRCVVCKALVPAVKTGDFDNDYAKWVIGLLISLNIIVGAIIYRNQENRITGLYHPFPKESRNLKREHPALFFVSILKELYYNTG